jgi:hypothetical protein
MDQFKQQARRTTGRRHTLRQLVCVKCVIDRDFVFGGVHSDRACTRCGAEPIGRGAVVGESAFAGGAPFV